MSESRIAVLESSHKSIEKRFDELSAQLVRMANAIERLATVSDRQDHLELDLRELKADFNNRKQVTDPIIMDAEKVKAEVITTIRITGAVIGFLQVVVLSFCGWVISEIGDIRKTQNELAVTIAKEVRNGKH